MKTIRKGRLLGTVLSVLTFSLAGHASQALAVTPVISHTGPDSSNTISINDVSECEITNNNSVNVNNSTNQNAESGDVDVSGNTNVGDDWGSWSPAAWKANGYTYAEWRAAFNAYMSANASSFANNWGSGSSDNGSASSGDASNNNNTRVKVNISNSDDSNCHDIGRGHGGGGGSSGGGTIHTTGPDSNNTIVLGSLTMNSLTNNNRTNVGNNTDQDAKSGDAYTDGNTNAGGSGGSGGSSNNNGAGTGVHIDNGNGGQPSYPSHGGTVYDASIRNTGPDSDNNITLNKSLYYSAQNNNNTSVNTYTDQDSETGDVSTSGNTHVDGAGSGDAENTNDSGAWTSVEN